MASENGIDIELSNVKICENEIVKKELDEKLKDINKELSSYEVDLDMYTPETDELNAELMDPEILRLKDLDGNIRNYQDLRQFCCNLLYISNIIKDENEQDKKVESCTDAVITAVEKAGLDIFEFKDIVNLIKKQKFVRLASFSDDNLINFSLVSIQMEDSKLEQKAKDLAKFLFKQTPYDFAPKRGSAGVGEFMFCVLDPGIEKPSAGDLIIPLKNNLKVELKGKNFSIEGKISSEKFKEKMKDLTKDIQVYLNELDKDIKKRIVDDGVRLDRYQYSKDFDALFNKMKELDEEGGLEKAKNFIKKWLDATEGFGEDFPHENYIKEIIFDKDNKITFNSKKLRKLTALSFLNHYFNEHKFDIFIRLGKEGDAEEIYKIKKETLKKPDIISKIIDPDCKILTISSTKFIEKGQNIAFQFQ